MNDTNTKAMRRLPEVVTAGGTATLEFGLADGEGKRLANVVADTVMVSLRRENTPRTQHELPLLPATLDPATATVTLKLSVENTMALAPSPGNGTGQVDVIGDVWVGGVDYYGPFQFTIRLPETHA